MEFPYEMIDTCDVQYSGRTWAVTLTVSKWQTKGGCSRKKMVDSEEVVLPRTTRVGDGQQIMDREGGARDSRRIENNHQQNKRE